MPSYAHIILFTPKLSAMELTITTRATELLQRLAGANAAKALGETEAAVSKAIELAVQQVAAAVQECAGSEYDALLHAYKSISGQDYTQGIPTLYGGLDTASHSDWSSRAGTVLGRLFDTQLHAALCTIEQRSGVKQSSATTLLGGAVPVVLGMIGEKKASDDTPAANLAATKKPADISERPADHDANIQNIATAVAAPGSGPLGATTDAGLTPVSMVDNTRVASEQLQAPQSLYGVAGSDSDEQPLVANPEPAAPSNWLLYLLLATILGLAIWWFTKE